MAARQSLDPSKPTSGAGVAYFDIDGDPESIDIRQGEVPLHVVVDYLRRRVPGDAQPGQRPGEILVHFRDPHGRPGSFTTRVRVQSRSSKRQQTTSERRRSTLRAPAHQELEVTIPTMDWEQVDGDVDPGAHGGTIARGDGDRLELLKIQPVREYVGDEEAKEVGFPFWTREASYDADDLDPSKKSVRSAMASVGLDQETFRGLTPTQRAVALATALLDYGDGAEEGPSGWSSDIIHSPVKWSYRNEVAGAEYLADEDEAFIHEVMLGDLDVDYESFGPNDQQPESGLRVRANNSQVEITEWQDIEAATGDEQPEGEQVVRTEATVDLDELFAPDGKHRGGYSGDSRAVTIPVLAAMNDEDREKAIVGAAIAYVAYHGGSEEFVDRIGD